MKSASAELINLLNTSYEFFMVDLFTITLVGGTILRYTSGDLNIYWNSSTFVPMNIERNEIKVVRGLEVDSLEITVVPKTYPINITDESEQDTMNGIPWIKAVRMGALDGATIKIERAFFKV